MTKLIEKGNIKLELINFMGLSGSYILGLNNIAIGKNGIGKTRVVAALEFALLGHVIGTGSKNPADQMILSSGEEMGVKTTFDNQDVYSRILQGDTSGTKLLLTINDKPKKIKTYEAELYELIGDKKIIELMLNLDVWDKLHYKKKVQLLYSHLSVGKVIIPSTILIISQLYVDLFGQMAFNNVLKLDKYNVSNLEDLEIDKYEDFILTLRNGLEEYEGLLEIDDTKDIDDIQKSYRELKNKTNDIKLNAEAAQVGMEKVRLAQKDNYTAAETLEYEKQQLTSRRDEFIKTITKIETEDTRRKELNDNLNLKNSSIESLKKLIKECPSPIEIDLNNIGRKDTEIAIGTKMLEINKIDIKRQKLGLEVSSFKKEVVHSESRIKDYKYFNNMISKKEFADVITIEIIKKIELKLCDKKELIFKDIKVNIEKVKMYDETIKNYVEAITELNKQKSALEKKLKTYAIIDEQEKKDLEKDLSRVEKEVVEIISSIESFESSGCKEEYIENKKDVDAEIKDKDAEIDKVKEDITLKKGILSQKIDAGKAEELWYKYKNIYNAIIQMRIIETEKLIQPFVDKLDIGVKTLNPDYEAFINLFKNKKTCWECGVHHKKRTSHWKGLSGGEFTLFKEIFKNELLKLNPPNLDIRVIEAEKIEADELGDNFYKLIDYLNTIKYNHVIINDCKLRMIPDNFKTIELEG